jgi:hypothetical protein
MAVSAAASNGSLPEVCTNQPAAMDADVGWCYGGVDYDAGLYDSALDCWNACWDLLDDQTW